MSLAARDLKHFWHPCSQMKDYEQFPPLEVTSAKGSYLHLKNGKTLIDANSSWWCKSLGHGEPRLKNAMIDQAERFEHVILANTTNETIVSLSEKLASLSASLDKVMYASDGSSAVEMAMKMAVHAQQLRGETKRTIFMSLENGYHGETSGALAISDLGLYRKPYESMLTKTHFIKNIPYVFSKEDPLWENCESHWPDIEKQLNEHQDSLCAIVIEPLLQGAGGMKIYSQDLIKRLSYWCKAHNIFLIADEILTGFGRLGKPLACEYADIEPDFVCLGKGLTAGYLPMSALLTRTDIYNLFYDDYETGKAFMHSHTYTGHALSASIALAVLTIYEEDKIYQQANSLANNLKEQMNIVADHTGMLTNIRSLGGVVAADLKTTKPRTGYAVYQAAVKQGALLRPLGNTLYWLPPLNTSLDTLIELRDITIHSIDSVMKS